MLILKCIFTSDVHGDKTKYKKLFEVVKEERPEGLFIGGDILPSSLKANSDGEEFLKSFLSEEIKETKKSVESLDIFVIMGNDDPRVYEDALKKMDEEGLINYMHASTKKFRDLYVTGYNFVPPTPFHLKDWEKYDVSRYVGIGAVSPEEGTRTVDVSHYEKKYTTIKDDLEDLVKTSPPEKTIYLFHSPPYDTSLDRAALDEKMIDHAPVDSHVGSIAIKRFIKEEQPLVTLHGHVHETVDITGEWKEKIGETFSFTGVHNGPELPILRFDTENLENATRTLVEI
ncbi:MAG: metallophosphoesterase [Candidatus Thermoplasmatota archaeon]|nr:metallophosphoesterase [Candidatus Thermoplasmatota archaeon]